MQERSNDFFNGYWSKIILIITIGILGRLIPHLPNVTPIIGLCLFARANLPYYFSLLVIAITLFISDLCLAAMFGYPMVSYATLFTYSGFAVVILANYKSRYLSKSLLFSILGSSFGFWIWTNFGVWLTSNWYDRSIEGLGRCYYLALPFLRNALIGDLIWGYLIFGAFNILLIKKVIKNSKCLKFC